MGRGRALDLDRQDFLANYWQRKPLLLRAALPDFTPPVSADELAGLAMEDEVESRIIERTGDGWQLHHGPFDAADYERGNPWTLLVQAVDHYLPEVAALRDLVDFLPRWRVDDVMVSYAADGGSVGPHYDNYDVFLLQGEGRRLWQVGPRCDSTAPLLPHDELRILRDFEAVEEYLLEPGDILYLPPGVAHWGIARGACTTFSIGFRAPRLGALVSRYTDALLETLDADLFYTDAGSAPAGRAGEIRPEDLERAREQVLAILGGRLDSRWFGEVVTEPRYECEPADAGTVLADLEHGASGLLLDAAARLAWCEEAGGLQVYANGDARCFPFALRELVERFCAGLPLRDATLADALAHPQARELLNYLLEAGCLYVERDEFTGG